MLSVIFRSLFLLDLALVGLAAVWALPKRKHLARRVALSTAAGALFACLWMAVFRGVDGTTFLLQLANYLTAFAFVLGCFQFCVQLKGWDLLFIGASMWSVQHIAALLERLLALHHGQTLSSLLGHLLLLLAVTFVVWLLFYRALDVHVLWRLKLNAVVPVLFIMLAACLFLDSYALTVGDTSTSLSLLDLLCTTVGLLYQGSLYRFCGSEREREGIDALLYQSKRQYETMKENIERVNIKCHDLRHQLQAFRQDGRVADAVLRDMEKAVDTYDTAVQTGNPALDVILTEKSTLCTSKGIGLTCMAEGAGLAYMEPGDLYALLGNALENAIEATEALRDPEKRQISFTMRRHKDFYVVCLQNYSDGRLLLANGLPMTTKQDKANHGFGVKSMGLLVKKYGGDMDFQQEGDVVSLTLLLPFRGSA